MDKNHPNTEDISNLTGVILDDIVTAHVVVYSWWIYLLSSTRNFIISFVVMEVSVVVDRWLNRIVWHVL